MKIVEIATKLATLKGRPPTATPQRSEVRASARTHMATLKGRPPTALVPALVLTASLTLAAQDGNGWRIGNDAADITNPLPASAEVMAQGADLFESKCRRCHGETGRGNGPDADPDNPPGNLTDARRAARNPDGVLFYKIWYGRRDPRMPAFGQELSRDEVWAVVHYITSLREGPTE